MTYSEITHSVSVHSTHDCALLFSSRVVKWMLLRCCQWFLVLCNILNRMEVYSVKCGSCHKAVMDSCIYWLRWRWKWRASVYLVCLLMAYEAVHCGIDAVWCWCAGVEINRCSALTWENLWRVCHVLAALRWQELKWSARWKCVCVCASGNWR